VTGQLLIFFYRRKRNSYETIFLLISAFLFHSDTTREFRSQNVSKKNSKSGNMREIHIKIVKEISSEMAGYCCKSLHIILSWPV